MVYIKVLCGIGHHSGTSFIRFQPAVAQVGTPRKARVVFQELERFFSLAPQKNFLQVEVSSQEWNLGQKCI